jgi:hypothetical protein
VIPELTNKTINKNEKEKRKKKKRTSLITPHLSSLLKKMYSNFKKCQFRVFMHL